MFRIEEKRKSAPAYAIGDIPTGVLGVVLDGPYRGRRLMGIQDKARNIAAVDLDDPRVPFLIGATTSYVPLSPGESFTLTAL